MNDLLQSINKICCKKEPAVKSILSEKCPQIHHIISWIYLLPITEPTEDHKNLAAAFSFFQLSQHCHEEVRNADTKFNGKSILLGDLFVAQAYQMVIGQERNTLLEDIAKIIGKSNEAWFTMQTLNPTQTQEVTKAIDNALGLLLRKAAEKGWEDGKRPSEQMDTYKECVTHIAYLSGCKKYHIDIDSQEIKDKINRIASSLGIWEAMKPLLSLL